MASPTYGDVTQVVDLDDVMLRTRERIATAQTAKDLDVALADFQPLRAEKKRRGEPVFHRAAKH